MNKSCPYCGIPVDGQAWCPLCEKRLVSVNLRRTLLWAFVLEEYLLVAVAMMRLA